jgi:hypothetical protein
MQVIGTPKIYPNYGDIEGSWAQNRASAQATNQFIELECNQIFLITVGDPNLSVYRVRTVFRDGPFRSTAQRTVLF